MSEYQFYEFKAIDKPLSKEDKTEISSWSSRSNPSNTGVLFTYSYGNFPQDVISVIEKYFDAMFYISNWGTIRLIFKFPKALLKIEGIKQYCTEDGLQIIEMSNCFILDINFSEDEGGNWAEGEGWLDSLISLRDDILNEDYRCLYLAWLKNSIAAAEGEWDTMDLEAQEPHIPGQLSDLNGALLDFIVIFEIDKDYITAATENCEFDNNEKQIELTPFLDQLSENEKDEFLVRLLNDEPLLNIKLKSRLKDFSTTNIISIKEKRSERTIDDIIKRGKEIKQERENKEKIELQEKQLNKLLTIEKQEIEIWARISKLITEKNTKAYDEVILRMLDLKELSIYKNRFNDFCEKIELIKNKYSRLSGLTSRLKDAKLIILK